MRILIIKTSSLGDLIHTLPALTDVARARPELTFDWLAEKPFAEIPRWHPAVGRVISSDLRQWRRHPLRTLFDGTWAEFRDGLQERRYDLVIDAQGLLKSAWLARTAHGPVAGPNRHSAREPLAALLYRQTYAIPPRDQAHAVERNRRLFAQALNYALPATAPDAGLNRAQFADPNHPRPYALLLHGTTWASKRWPEASWTQLGQWLREQGVDALLPWGTIEEREQAKRIACAGGGILLERQSLTALAGWLAHARAFVGVDTGLAHLGAALGTPGITLYGPTLPHLTGALGPNQSPLTSGDAATVDRKRPTTVEVSRVQAALTPWL